MDDYAYAFRRLVLDEVLAVSTENFGRIIMRGGHEFMWPDSLELGNKSSYVETDTWTRKRHALLDRLMEVLQTEFKDAVKVHDRLLWRPSVQKGWSGVMTLESGVDPSPTGHGGRWLVVSCPPTLRYRFNLDTDAQVEDALAHFKHIRESRGWFSSEEEPPSEVGPSLAKVVVLWFHEGDSLQTYVVSVEYRVEPPVKGERPAFTHKTFWLW